MSDNRVRLFRHEHQVHSANPWICTFTAENIKTCQHILWKCRVPHSLYWTPPPSYHTHPCLLCTHPLYTLMSKTWADPHPSVWPPKFDAKGSWLPQIQQGGDQARPNPPLPHVRAYCGESNSHTPFYPWKKKKKTALPMKAFCRGPQDRRKYRGL